MCKVIECPVCHCPNNSCGIGLCCVCGSELYEEPKEDKK